MEIMQIGLNSADLSASLRLYADAFGFRNGGGHALWGETMRVHGLDPSNRALMWWMVGDQQFCQLEFFNHFSPGQRPLPKDWRPCDIGWVRMGLELPDLAAALAVLEREGIAILGRDEGDGNERPPRAAFRDPQIGHVVELRERAGIDGPRFLYATSSVSDLEGARRYYRDVIGLEIAPLETLHEPADEALWGLPGARREGFVASIGDRHLEIVHYIDPAGRPQPDDFRIADQGIMNVAFGSHSLAEIEALLTRLEAAGHRPPHILRMEGLLAGYIVDSEREIEFAVIPEGMEAALGFEPALDFFT